jgi:scyllo-inositol 2-dehydrogenase (NADP+)
MSRIIKVGLAGFGLSGRYFHAPFLAVHPGFRVDTVVSTNASLVQQFDDSIVVTNNFEQLLQTDDIELIFVCTPNHLHFSYAKAALDAGKNVVIEKPFANNQKDAETLAELADKKGLLLTAYQNRRWDADFLTIQQLITDGLLGDIVEYEAYFDRYRPEVLLNTWKERPEAGAGNLYNLGPHLADQALTLFGLPRYVSAIIKTIRKGGFADDYFDIRLDYEDKQVRLHASLLASNNDLRYKIHGTKASFLKNGLDIQEDTLKTNQLPNTDDWGQEPQSQWGQLWTNGEKTIIPSLAGNYSPFYANLYEAIVNKTALYVTPQQAIATTRTIDLAFESSRTGKRLSF